MRVNMTRKTALTAMKEAFRVASFSECRKKKVGAVVYVHKYYDNWEYETNGYGGFIEECPVNEKGECPKYYMKWAHDTCWSIHAEQKALELYTNEFHNSILFVTHGPCDQCLKHMVNKEIKKVVFCHDYKTDYSKWYRYIEIQSFKDFLKECK